MYSYSIFSVKPKVAFHYIYKTGVLFRFFKEIKENPNYKYLQLQYNYVVEPIELSTIATYLQDTNFELGVEMRDLYLKINWKGKSITIFADGRHLEVTCSSIEDVEEFLFPVLRHSQGFYFVISNRMNDYGWLSVKNHRLLDNQLSYSFR